jgi:SAM-dependent methyltransferase
MAVENSDKAAGEFPIVPAGAQPPPALCSSRTQLELQSYELRRPSTLLRWAARRLLTRPRRRAIYEFYRHAAYRVRASLSSVASLDFIVPFRCNICGTANRVSHRQFAREVQSCTGCGSSVRMRAVVRCLSLLLFGRSVPLTEMPADRSIQGIGLSDWEGYSDGLARLFSYRNTFFHTEPRVDITDPPRELLGALDFLISTDVFEHVPPPVDRAFAGAFALLKPGGVLVLSVPFHKAAATVEHFPALNDFQLLRFGEDYYLMNQRRDGTYEMFDKLVFHGGPGETLEMRFFSEADLMAYLARAGFEKIVVHREDDPLSGVIHHHERCSVPITAVKPAATEPGVLAC